MKPIGMSNEELKAAAPSIFATAAWSGVSDRYTFIPTIRVIDALRDVGFVPTQAGQSRTRVDGKRPFTKHLIRFQSQVDAKKYPRVVDGNANYFYKKGEAPNIAEINIINSHDLSAAYQINAGIYRRICSNGLVVCSARIGSIHIRHSGEIVDEVVGATRHIVKQMPAVLEQIQEWTGIELSTKDRDTLARAVLIQRYGLDEEGKLLAPIQPQQILEARRPEDRGHDLWSTTNVIQENVMRGALPGISHSGRKTKTRAIKSINADLKFNRDVWTLSETFAKRLTVH